MPSDAYAIIGMQYGSEAKGALAGYLARVNLPDVCVSNWSPNAGHTYKDGDYKLVRRCIPIGAYISPNCKYALLGPGSIIDPTIFYEEMAELPEWVTVVVHPFAAVVMPRHLEAEAEFDSIGSTKKGAGAAAMERMARQMTANVALMHLNRTESHGRISVDENLYHQVLGDSNYITQIEGCQGFSLSMYNGFYPYTTSRDTSIHQLKADIAWHGSAPVATYGALRTYPIRVAGTSGPCYADQEETSWEALGVEPETTTVTKKIRRVFTFSPQQIFEAQMINGCDELYLSFCDYLDEDDVSLSRILEICADISGKLVKWQSFGPDLKDMVDCATVNQISYNATDLQDDRI